MKISEMISAVEADSMKPMLERLYGENAGKQKERYLRVLANAEKRLGDREAGLYSAPGRTEVGGNHTDHQLGRVLAASINLDVLAVVSPRDDLVVDYQADSFSAKPVDLHDLSVQAEEVNSTEALIRGVAAAFAKDGLNITGFDCYAESDVLPGSGVSSSAAFEILLAEIFNDLSNEGKATPEDCAVYGKYAENVYFGKASGLLDQMACSVGGFVTIDFKDAQKPVVQKISRNLEDLGYAIILTDCHESHADLSDEYSKIPAEMKSVAALFGRNVLSEVTLEEFVKAGAGVRQACGDRAFLRAYHFLNETDRVVDEVKALEDNDMKTFLSLIKESGRSSWMYLQNVIPVNATTHQSLAVGQAMSEYLLKDNGAWRVHGGGFAGTIQAFVPLAEADHYIEAMEGLFGKGSCYKLRIRDVGGIRIA